MSAEPEPEAEDDTVSPFTGDLTPELAEAFGLEAGRGAVVAEVLEDSAAEAAGLQPGDVIISVEKRDIRNFDALRNAIGLHREGDTLKLRYLRNGKERSTKVKLGADQRNANGGSGLHSKLEGVRFENADDDEGVEVAQIQPGSVAAEAGLRRGDIIDAVNRKEVRNLSDLRNHLRNEEDDARLLLRVRRGEGALFLLIR